MPSIPRAECFHSLAYTSDYREWWVGENLKRSDKELLEAINAAFDKHRSHEAALAEFGPDSVKSQYILLENKKNSGF